MTRILVGDDAELILALESSFLKRQDCEILTASSGGEVLERAREAHPDLALLDSSSAGGAVLDCCRTFKTDPELREVAVVCIGGADLDSGCRAAGADGFVTRPFTRRRLLEVIGKFVPQVERAGPRRVAALAVRYRASGRAGTGETKDVSSHGLFLRTKDPVPAGETVELNLDLPDDAGAPLGAAGRVVRRVESDCDSHLIPGLGIELSNLADGDHERLARFVSGRPAVNR